MPAPLLADNSTLLGYVALGAVVIITTMSLMRNRRRSRGAVSPSAFAREQIARLKEEGSIKGDMEELLVELQELSRQINAQIDTRFARLEASIRAADQRIDALQRLERRADGAATVDVVVDDAGPAQSDSRPAPAAHPHAHIYAQADSGKSSVDIAREIGRTTGEVELILALRAKPSPAG